MKFYRVSYSTNGGNSGGFSWHTRRADAVKRARKDYDNDPDEYDNVFAPDDRIEVIEVVPTKAGILAALNRYADHPNNG